MSHADHEWARELIAAHLAGGLSAEERARMEAHVAVCAECIAEINEAGRFERGLEAAFAPARPAVGLEDRVLRALRAAPGRRPWGLFGKFLAAAAAAGLLGAVGYAILEMEHPSTDRVAVQEARLALRDGRESGEGKGWDGYLGLPSQGGLQGEVPRFRQERLAEVEELNKLQDRAGADHNETADEAEFKKAKGDDLDFVSGVPFKGKGTYDAIGGGGGGGGRFGGKRMGGEPAADPAAAAPADGAVLAVLEKQQQGQSFYSYRDNAPAQPGRGGEAFYFKPGQAAPPEEKLAKANKESEQLGRNLVRRQEGVPPPPVTRSAAPPQNEPAPQPVRKIIRSGEVEFEVESFDTSVAVIQKIAAEERGFIATVNSEKLANGKVRGSVVVRVPPEGLDTLLLKLRALGDLKSQRIGSQDVTKAFYDSESRLRAARAMEERLLKIIQEGKGEIKDLLLAEKELGEWRTKIEQAEGEIRYYNNLINLSTLTVTLQEKEIRAASGVVRTERVDMAVEVEDVEKAHREALAAIAEVKGRVTRSELKQHAAGQFSSILHFEVAPGASGPLRDRLRQLGTPARMDVNVVEENEGGPVRPGTDLRVVQKDSQFQLSMYNLANIQPRETTHLNLACLDAEKAYADILARVEKAGGRVVSSHLNRQRNDQTTGTVHFEVKTAEAEAVLLDVRAAGEVMRYTTTENPDVQNVTKSKRGFQVQLFAMGTVAPRETASVRVAAKDVGAAFQALVEAARKGGARILVSQLNEGDRRNVNARLDVDVRRENEADVEAAIRAAGELLQRTSHRSEDAENVVDSKLRINVTVLDLANLAPRETTKLSLAAKDVAASYKALVEAARKADAWVQQSYLAETDPQKVTAVLNLDVRREQEAVVAAAIGAAGTVHTRTAQRAPENSGAVESKVRYEIQIFDRARIDPRETHTLAVEVGDVAGAVGRLEQIAAEAKGQVEDAQHRRDSRTGQQTSVLTLRVPLAEAAGAIERIEKLGALEAKDGQKHPNVPLNETATARLVVTLSNDLILSPDAGPWANIKRGLGVSLTALSYALMLIMIGVCFVLPIALIALGAVKLYKKLKAKAA